MRCTQTPYASVMWKMTIRETTGAMCQRWRGRRPGGIAWVAELARPDQLLNMFGVTCLTHASTQDAMLACAHVHVLALPGHGFVSVRRC